MHFSQEVSVTHLTALSVLVIAAAATLAARPPDPPTRNTPHTLASCTPYTPSGTVHINVNAQQSFVPDSICSGLTITISPSNGTAGFINGSACSQTTYVTGGIGTFKIRGCQSGTATVTVTQGSTVLQTIDLVIDPV